MSRSNFRSLTSGVIATMACTGLVSAQPAPVPLSLADAVSRGLDASHRLVELAARQKSAEAGAASMRTGALPQVAVQGGYTRTNHVDAFAILQPTGRLEIIYPDVPDNLRTRLDMQWALYSGGRIEASADAAQAEARAGGRDVDAGRSDLRLAIAGADRTLVTAAETVGVFERALERATELVSEARARFDAGFVPPSDVMSAEARRSSQEALLIQTRNNRAVAELELGRLVGLDPGTPIVPVEPLDEPPAPPVQAGDLAARALQQRADRKAAEERVTAADQRRRGAEGERLPTLFVAGGFDYARPNPRIFPRAAEWNSSWDVSLNVSWTLFDWGRAKADVASAAYARDAARARLDELDTVIGVEVRQRQLELASARAALGATASAVESAEEARRVLQQRYDVGVGTSMDVLDAQVVLLQTELERTRARANVRLAAARLERAVGYS